ncbi:MAG: Ribulose-phosphate 3-epimerase [Parcubacteria group bacterium GW2011_GWA2_51_10]|nr:MAG: Ribulose-phosphate 3-epimerase [Parcubacteria group bacterium GW2011_GWA2_51_10]
MIEIVPTAVVLKTEDLQLCSKLSAFAEWVHIDIDDGIFAPVISWPYTKKGIYEVPDLSALGNLKAEIHLMVETERKIGLLFARAGARRIIGHVEAFDTTEAAHGALDVWKKAGAEAGLSILLDTPLPVLGPLVPACDFVQVMSVATIGLQGALFDPRAIERIAELNALYPELLISVDGGVSSSNIVDLARAGARRFSVGAAISKSADPAKTYAALKIAAESAST